MKFEDDVKQAAIARYPDEMVGYVKDGKFFELENVSKTPKTHYNLSIRDKLYILDNDIDYLVHSHPSNNNNPSQKDTQSQKSCNIPFLIVGTDGKTTTEIKEVS